MTYLQCSTTSVVVIVILLTSFQVLCRNISGIKLKVHSLFDGHLLMKNYPVHSLYVSLNQSSDNTYKEYYVGIVLKPPLRSIVSPHSHMETLQLHSWQHAV